MNWEIAQPSPEHEAPFSTGRLPGAALESAPRAVAVGSPVSTEPTCPQLTLTTTIDAGELLLFRSDLGSSLEGVMVCAVGRALSANPDVNVTVADRVGGPAIVPAAASSVQLVVLCDDGLRAGTVDAGAEHSLTEVRDAVAALVDGLRAGRAPLPSEPAAISLRTFALSGAVLSGAVTPPASSALAVGRLAGARRTMQVSLSVDARVIEAEQASRLLATIVRLVQQPYRRLR